MTGCAIIFAPVLGSPVFADGGNVIKDDHIKKYINERMGYKPDRDITKEAVAKLIFSDFESLGAENIEGLEYATHFTSLKVSKNKISDITPVAKMTNLEFANFNDNKISDIKPLAGLTKLYSLGLYTNNIKDISPLATLENLNSLSLGENEIENIAPLKDLKNLRTLYLYDNQIKDVAPLAGLTELTDLRLDTNKLSDVSALSSLGKLEKLHLEENEISDISTMKGLSSLEELDLGKNKIEKLDGVDFRTNFPDLQKLRLSGNRISDLGAFAGMTELTSLSLANNRIENVAPLKDLTKLQLLEVQGNSIADLSPLSKMEHKYSVDATDQKITRTAKAGRIENPLKSFDGSTVILEDKNLTNLKVDGKDLVLVDPSKEGTAKFQDAKYRFSGTITVEPAQKFSVKVENGTADRTSCEAGEKVTIKADKAPEGKAFDRWEVVKGGAALADASKAETTFSMPAADVTVKALYK